MSDSNNPVNANAEQGGVSSGICKEMRDTSQNPAVYSEVRQQEDTQNPNTWKQQSRSDSSDSSVIWKQMRGMEIHMNRSKIEFHNMQISSHQCLGKVFQNLQKKLGITETSPKLGIEAIKTNALMWGLFMSSTMKAAIHLGPNYTENLKVYKNTNFEEIQNLFGITQKLFLEHSDEILNVKFIESIVLSWMRFILFHDQVIKWTKAIVRVYSDSVLCSVKLSDYSEANRRWEGQVADFRLSASDGELLGIDGEPTEFEWIISLDLLHCRFFRRSRIICKNET